MARIRRSLDYRRWQGLSEATHREPDRSLPFSPTLPLAMMDSRAAAASTQTATTTTPTMHEDMNLPISDSRRRSNRRHQSTSPPPPAESTTAAADTKNEIVDTNDRALPIPHGERLGTRTEAKEPPTNDTTSDEATSDTTGSDECGAASSSRALLHEQKQHAVATNNRGKDKVKKHYTSQQGGQGLLKGSHDNMTDRNDNDLMETNDSTDDSSDESCNVQDISEATERKRVILNKESALTLQMKEGSTMDTAIDVDALDQYPLKKPPPPSSSSRTERASRTRLSDGSMYMAHSSKKARLSLQTDTVGAFATKRNAERLSAMVVKCSDLLPRSKDNKPVLLSQMEPQVDEDSDMPSTEREETSSNESPSVIVLSDTDSASRDMTSQKSSSSRDESEQSRASNTGKESGELSKLDESIPEEDRKPAALPDFEMRKRPPPNASIVPPTKLPRQIEFKSPAKSDLPSENLPLDSVTTHDVTNNDTSTNGSKTRKRQRRLIFKTCRDLYPRPESSVIQRAGRYNETSTFYKVGEAMTFQISILDKKEAMLLGNPILQLKGRDDTSMRDVRQLITDIVTDSLHARSQENSNSLWEFFVPNSGTFIKYELEPMISLCEYLDECCFGRQLAVRLVGEHSPAIIQLIQGGDLIY